MKPFIFENQEDFDSHIENSIPAFVEMRELLLRIIPDFEVPHTNVVDIGCSTGKLLKSIDKYAPDGVVYHGCDPSFSLETDEFIFHPCDFADLGFDIQDIDTSVISSIFTLQFMSPKERRSSIETIHQILMEGGVALIAEKVFLDNPKLNRSCETALESHKRKTFSCEDIFEKQQQISRNMNCVTENELLNELKVFDYVSCIWAWGNFRLYFCQK